MSKPTLFIVDDDPIITNYVAEIATEIGYEATQMGTGKELLNRTSQDTPSVVVLDVVMPDLDGIEVLQALADRNTEISIILISGYHEHYIDTANVLGKAQGLKIMGTLHKPFSPDELKALLKNIH